MTDSEVSLLNTEFVYKLIKKFRVPYSTLSKERILKLVADNVGNGAQVNKKEKEARELGKSLIVREANGVFFLEISKAIIQEVNNKPIRGNVNHEPVQLTRSSSDLCSENTRCIKEDAYEKKSNSSFFPPVECSMIGRKRKIIFPADCSPFASSDYYQFNESSMYGINRPMTSPLGNYRNIVNISTKNYFNFDMNTQNTGFEMEPKELIVDNEILIDNSEETTQIMQSSQVKRSNAPLLDISVINSSNTNSIFYYQLNNLYREAPFGSYITTNMATPLNIDSKIERIEFGTSPKSAFINIP